MGVFIGRKHELQVLSEQLKKRVASLIVLRGRRRIGKSRLIEEFSKPYPTYIFTGIPPTSQTTLESQIEEFMNQFRRLFSLSISTKTTEWGDVFWLLQQQLPTSRVILVFDEISWMGSKDPDFLGKLKTAWDLYFKKNDKLMLILCGSVSAWIEKNILSNTGFVGRISSTLTLGELSLTECNKFFCDKNNNISAYQKFKILAVTGGIPRYLEEIRSELSADQNLKNICFSKEGFLFSEFDRLFSDIFLTNSLTYRKTLNALISQKLEPSELANAIDSNMNNINSQYFNELVLAGFLARDFTWHIKNRHGSKLSKYRLKDNYSRFYLKYILPNKHKIEAGAFADKALNLLPGWSSIMALQFENLVLNNRNKIWNKLGISSDEIVWDNPFFQKANTKQPGCQIDYMIQTRSNNLYLCEIKFSQEQIKKDVILEMQQKIDNLQKPKGFSYRPILIHVNGANEFLREQDFFANIIDFSEFLND